jgi:predicted tellurium resistance membrane protein TerC
MIKILELIGFALVAIMFISFVGFIPGQESGFSPLFWGCAVGTFAIILYRKKKRKEKEPT